MGQKSWLNNNEKILPSYFRQQQTILAYIKAFYTLIANTGNNLKKRNIPRGQFLDLSVFLNKHAIYQINQKNISFIISRPVNS